MKKETFCYYTLATNEKDYAKELVKEYGFKNLSQYIRESLVGNHKIIERSDQPSVDEKRVFRDEYKFRISFEDLDKVRIDASNHQITVSEYVRHKILKRRINKREIISDPKLSLLKKIYGLLKYEVREKASRRDYTKLALSKLNEVIDKKRYSLINYEKLNALGKILISEIDNRGKSGNTILKIFFEFKKATDIKL